MTPKFEKIADQPMMIRFAYTDPTVMQYVAGLQRQVADLSSALASLMSMLASNPAPPSLADLSHIEEAHQKQELYWRQWADSLKGPPDNTIRDAVLEQLRKVSPQSPVDAMGNRFKSGPHGIQSDPRPPVRRGTDVFDGTDHPARKGMDTVSAVLTANDIPLGMTNEKVNPGDTVHFVLPAHRLSQDVHDFFTRVLGPNGWTLEGNPDPAAPVADIRKRPDLFFPKGATSTSFDGSTGTRNTQIKMTDPGVPNASDKEQ